MSLPLTLGPAVGVAFIPVDGWTLGIISIALVTIGISYTLCRLFLYLPLFATKEHKALSAGFGPPIVATGFMFFGLISAHLTLAQVCSGPLIGVNATRWLFCDAPACNLHPRPFGAPVVLLAQAGLHDPALAVGTKPSRCRPCHRFWVTSRLSMAPRLRFSRCASGMPHRSQRSSRPCSHQLQWPEWLAWSSRCFWRGLPALASCSASSFELCIAAKLAAKVEFPWQMRFAKMSALELVYLHSLGGTGYIAPTRAACIGCARAATTTFGDPYAIVWLDISTTVWQVLLAQVASQADAAVFVLAVRKMGLQQLELSAQFAAGHPLANAALRAFGLQGYVLVSGQHASNMRVRRYSHSQLAGRCTCILAGPSLAREYARATTCEYRVLVSNDHARTRTLLAGLLAVYLQ